MTDIFPLHVQLRTAKELMLKGQKKRRLREDFGVKIGHMEVSRIMGVPRNGWFIMENPIKMDWVPPF